VKIHEKFLAVGITDGGTGFDLGNRRHFFLNAQLLKDRHQSGRDASPTIKLGRLPLENTVTSAPFALRSVASVFPVGPPPTMAMRFFRGASDDMATTVVYCA